MLFEPLVLNEGQMNSLVRNLEEWLEKEGVNPMDIGGLEVDYLEKKGWMENGKWVWKNWAYYSMEDRNNKIRRGEVFFTANLCENKLEDVNFE